MPAPVRFYFDYISPYAYIAWTQLHALAEAYGREVEPAPVLFAAMLNANDTRGPAEIPAKRIYVFKDIMRTAAVLGIPLTPPPTHPFNPLLALRITSLPMSQEVRRALVTRYFYETWGGGSGITSDEHVRRIAEEHGVEDPGPRANSPEVKKQLRTATQRAMNEGVFGVPSMMVDGELFWGYDSFGHLERALRGEDPIDSKSLIRWAGLPSSATRI